MDAPITNNDVKKKFCKGDEHKPLIFFVTGAAGTGKTAIIPALYKLCPNEIVIDMDALHPTLEDWDAIKNIWAHVAYQIFLNGRATIICGMYFPWEFDQVDLKEKFTPIFIGLFCKDEVILERLSARGWSEERIADQQHCNRWIIEHAGQAFGREMSLVDSSDASPFEVGRKVKKVITKILRGGLS